MWALRWPAGANTHGGGERGGGAGGGSQRGAGTRGAEGTGTERMGLLLLVHCVPLALVVVHAFGPACTETDRAAGGSIVPFWEAVRTDSLGMGGPARVARELTLVCGLIRQSPPLIISVRIRLCVRRGSWWYNCYGGRAASSYCSTSRHQY